MSDIAPHAFGDELDMEWLAPELRREGVADAYDALRALATTGGRPSEEQLDAMIDALRGRAPTTDVDDYPDD